MRKLHVIGWKELVDPKRLSAKTVVVIDTLFATTSIAMALSRGVREVVPARDEAEARQLAERLEQRGYVLAGERHMVTPPGFALPTPVALGREPLAGKSLIYATTNGTVSLAGVQGAEHVCTAALVNVAAVVGHLCRVRRHGTVLLVCAGARQGLSLEDFYTAGRIADRLLAGAESAWQISDAARAARHLCGACSARECLGESRVGRMVIGMGLQEEVFFAAQSDVLSVVPVLEGGRLRVR